MRTIQFNPSPIGSFERRNDKFPSRVAQLIKQVQSNERIEQRQVKSQKINTCGTCGKPTASQVYRFNNIVCRECK